MRTLICLIAIAFLGGLSQLAYSQEFDPKWTTDDLWKYSTLGDVSATQEEYVLDVVAVEFGCDRRQLRGPGCELSADQSR